MMINKTTSMNASITLKDTNGNDTVVAYLTTSIDGSNQNFNINMNCSNKTLLTSVGATNVAGETAQVQYSQFEAAVIETSKELGFTIFA